MKTNRDTGSGGEAGWGVPPTWVWSTMGAIAEVVGGGTPSTADPLNFERGDVPWITPADLSGYAGKYISRGARNITQRGLNGSGARLMPAGTILFSSRAPIGYIAIAGGQISTNQGFKSFVLGTGIAADYIYYYLQRARPIATALASGTTFLEISGAKAALIPVPLAPLPEQRRIVAEIETQFARLEAGVAALKHVQANLKRYRAAVLRAACEGRLVPTEAELARAEGREYEPAGHLLERMLAEHGEWRAHRPGKFQAQCRTLRAGGATGERSEPVGQDLVNSEGIPEGWVWTTVGRMLAEPICNGISVKGTDEPPGVPSLKLNAMGDHGFNYGLVRFLPLAAGEVACLHVLPGDFFVSRGNGSLALVGRGTLAQAPPFPVVFPDLMMRLRLVPSAKAANWLPTIWSSAIVRRQIERKAKTTAGIWKVAQPDVASIAVPLPPLAEQCRAVAEIERRLSIIDETEAIVEANLKRAERLRQAILKRAFEGKLVPQDPNDEPASVLLERIRAERMAADGKGLKRGVRRSRTSEDEYQPELNLG